MRCKVTDAFDIVCAVHLLGRRVAERTFVGVLAAMLGGKWDLEKR